MTYLRLIDDRDRAARRFEASLHGMQLAGDVATGPMGAGVVHNRSHAALERMKARQRMRGDR